MKAKKSNPKQNNAQLLQGFAQLLADTYLVYLKTQNFHWNVTGEDFFEYHKMFEEQYEELAEATDEIAERMRALHARAPASFAQYLKLTSLKESENNLSAMQMIQTLMKDNDAISKTLAKLISLAQICEDEVTVDLFIKRKAAHDKTAWMLRSTLGQY